jgi:hypothetical protein
MPTEATKVTREHVETFIVDLIDKWTSEERARPSDKRAGLGDRS